MDCSWAPASVSAETWIAAGAAKRVFWHASATAPAASAPIRLTGLIRASFSDGPLRSPGNIPAREGDPPFGCGSGTPGAGEAYWFLVKDNPAGTFDTGCPSQVGSRDFEIMSAGDICVN